MANAKEEVRSFIAKRSFATLQEGDYIGTIVSSTPTLSKRLKTPQIANLLENDDAENPGKITLFSNDRGYEHDDNGDVVFDENNNPVEDKGNTIKAQNMFLDVAACAGLPEGEDFILDDLVGKKIGFTVENRNGYMKVVSWKPAEDMAEILALQEA